MRAHIPACTLALLFASACDSSFAASAALDGTWVSPSAIPGSYYTMTLSAGDSTVSGAGTKFIEAGAPAPFTVAGTRHGLGLSLALVFSPHDTVTYTAHLATDVHLSGTLARTGQDPTGEDFFKR
jgi:hypothetical protein